MAGRIQQIRKSIDAKLDALQAQAEALDAQLASTGREAQQRIDRQKQALRDALDHLKKEFQRQRGVAAETSKKLATAIDELKVQIALGKADAIEALDAQRKKLGESIARFEAEADSHLAGAKQYLDSASDTVMRRYVQACDALDAELQAAKARLKQQIDLQGPVLERRKQELNEKIAVLRRQLAEQRKRQTEKWRQFQRELEPGLSQLAKAFKGLFS
jgi:chromosome segregation ATPase